MKAQKTSPNQHTPAKGVSPHHPSQSAPLPIGIQAAGKTPTSSSTQQGKGVVRPPSSPLPPKTEVKEDPTVEKEELADETQTKKTKTPKHPQGHKVKNAEEVLAGCNSSKFVPVADGLYTGDMYFHPVKVHEVRKNWIDMEFIEYFWGEIIWATRHIFVSDADDILRMIYLKEMLSYDDLKLPRVTFEEWLVNVFSDIVKENASADFSDHGMIVNYLMNREDFSWCIGSSPNLQVVFQKRCIRDFDKGESLLRNLGTNPNVFKCKALRSKFEYVIEGRIISLHQFDVGEIGDVPESQDPNADMN